MVDLKDVLAGHAWWWHRDPFPHVRASSVFVPSFFADLSAAFREACPTSSESSYAAEYDLFGRDFSLNLDGPWQTLVSRQWCDMLATLFGIQHTGQVNGGMHHHAAGSSAGQPHNDLNPGWFADYRSDDGIILSRPDLCSYATGRRNAADVGTTVAVRAVSVLLYLENTGWQPGDGGETGLYRHGGQDAARPVTRVPPVNNSMLAFECTPYSFHAFLPNRHPRNSIVMWLHRSWADAVSRWGSEHLVHFPHD